MEYRIELSMPQIDYDEISDDPYVMLQTALDNEEEARDFLGGSW